MWRLILTSLLTIGSVLARSDVSVLPPPSAADQTAIIAANIDYLVSSTPSSTGFPNVSASGTALGIKPDLLPHLHYRPFKAFLANRSSTAATSTATVAATKPKTPTTTVAVSPPPLNAQAFLKATALSFKERRDGPYEAVFTTTAGSGNLTWGFDAATVGGANGVPKFAITYSCDPQPTLPIPGDPDQNPTFNVHTLYDCNVTASALTGTDQRPQSKDFPFTTPAGQFIVTPPASMNTVLRDDENDGGFTFNNEDSQPVTLSGLTIDVSFRALNLAEGPLVLRFVNPATGLSLYDYHLENLPADPSGQFLHSQAGIQIPFSFTLAAGAEKLLPIQVLGVHRMSIQGIDPTITITLRGVATDPPVGKLILGQALISWSCVVPFGSYDPNATSGAFAAGNACLQ